MFIANRLVPQHKQFLDEHGYEFREYPEHEFERRLSQCVARTPEISLSTLETRSTPGILAPTTYELLYEIEKQPMTMCYKMLLLMLMAELPDSEGRVPLRTLAERFQEFFVQRAIHNKAEENPNRATPGSLSRKNIVAWQRIIRQNPVRFLTESFVIDEGVSIRWSPRIWSLWSTELSREIRTACLDRLIRYFNRHVPGGY